MTADYRLLREDLKREEGLRLKPYHCTEGKLTIGYGRNLEERGITEREAEMMLENDIMDVGRQLDRSSLSWWRELPEPQARALSLMVFQLGIGGVTKFKKMLGWLRTGDFGFAADEALNSRWASQTPERAQRVADLMRTPAPDS